MISFNELKRNLKKDSSRMKKFKFAILADSSSQLLTQAIAGYAIGVDYYFETFEADYNQIESQVFNESSEFYKFIPDIVFINYSSEHFLSEFYKCNNDQKKEFSKLKINLISQLIDAINSKIVCKIIFNNFIEIQDGVFGNFASRIDESFIYQLRSLNSFLSDRVRTIQNVFICDFVALQTSLGYNFIFDPKLFVTSDIVYSIDFLPFIAKQILDIVKAINGDIKKCLVLDLDNTIWGGIIGDDGISQIQIGSLGLGKAFSQIQFWAKQLKERGVILCICSKNTLEIAQEPFTKHPEMVLRLDDISVFVANWETKVDNIKHIQKILNISFDSIVFIDDNPFEREMVKIGIPQITVPDLPEDPADYISYLRSLNLFETISFTNEDSQRTQLYQEEALRSNFQNTFFSELDFLRNLQMISNISSFDDFNMPRIAQLSQRSNQFNLRTVRYTEDELEKFSVSSDYITIAFDLADRFGEHGLISAVVLKRLDKNSLFIDSWIMSCRVLKRGMENFTLNYIVEKANEIGVTSIVGEYIPTKKNQIVEYHYSQLGFMQIDGLWVLDVNDFVEKETLINRK